MRPIGIVASAYSDAESGPPVGNDLPEAPDAIWQEVTGAISTTTWSHSVAETVPAGKLLVMSYVTYGPLAGTSVTDSAGNTWTTTEATQESTTTTRGSIAYTVVTNSLTTSDTISVVSSDDPIQRAAAYCLVWSWSFSSVVQGAWQSISGSNQASLPAEVPANSVLVGTHGMLNPGRDTTVGGIWTGLTKLATTNGSGDRALQTAWAVDAIGGNYAYEVTYSSGGNGVTSFLAFAE